MLETRFVLRVKNFGSPWARRGESCERCDFHFSDVRLFPRRDCLLARLRTAEVTRRFPMLENVVLILISLLLFGYLMYALLKPENF